MLHEEEMSELKKEKYSSDKIEKPNWLFGGAEICVHLITVLWRGE